MSNNKCLGFIETFGLAACVAAADAAVKYLAGEENEHYIGCDYVKVTTDNVADIKEMTK